MDIYHFIKIYFILLIKLINILENDIDLFLFLSLLKLLIINYNLKFF